MTEDERTQDLPRLDVAKNRRAQAEEIAMAIANLRKVAEAARRRAENGMQVHGSDADHAPQS